MEPTTQRVLRESLAEVILGTVPNDSAVDFPWVRVRQISEVAGATARTFLARFLPGEPVDDGLYGDGWEQEADLQIWVSYANMLDDEDGPFIDEDARQLTCRFLDLLSPAQVNGLLPVKYRGWSAVVDDPGKSYGYMTFAVRYLVSDRADGGSTPP
jgi:hypothetical protein